METLQTIKRRLTAIDSLIKAMSAMKMVSTVKLAKINGGRKDYADAIKISYDMLCRVAFEANFDQSIDSRFWLKREAGKTLILLFSTDQGFCGSFNQTILERGTRIIQENAGAFVEVVGRKNAFLRTNSINFEGSFDIPDRFDINAVANVLAKLIMQYIFEHNVYKVLLISGEFKNVLVQKAKVTEVLPIKIENFNEEYSLIEGNKQRFIEDIFMKYLHSVLCFTMKEHVISELSARTMSMDNSVRNAKDMFVRLNILYNRIRQFKITQELTEIVSSIECMR